MSRWTKKPKRKPKSSTSAKLKRALASCNTLQEQVFVAERQREFLQRERDALQKKIRNSDFLSVTRDVNPRGGVEFRLGLCMAVDRYEFMHRATSRDPYGVGNLRYMAAMYADQVRKAVEDRLIQEFSDYFGMKRSPA